MQVYAIYLAWRIRRYVAIKCTKTPDEADSRSDLCNNSSECGKSTNIHRVLVYVISNIYSHGPNSENKNGGSERPFLNTIHNLHLHNFYIC